MIPIPNSLKYIWEWFCAGPYWNYTQLGIAAIIGLIFLKIVFIIMAGPAPEEIIDETPPEKNKWRTCSNLITILLVFNIMSLIAWGMWKGYGAWEETQKSKTLMAAAGRLRLPQDPAVGKVWFGIKIGQKWVDTEFKVTPGQQVILQQIWETIHGQRPTRFPMSSDGKAPYDPKEDPQNTPLPPPNINDPNVIRKNPDILIN